MSNGIYKGGMNRKIAISSFIAVAMVLLVLGSIQPVGAWTRIAPIYINNTGGNALAYYQVNLTVLYDSDMNTNFSDLRVVRVVNETYEFLPYWIENKSDGEWCLLWFNATYIPANSWCNDTYYLLYGNASANSASDGDATFNRFDDFEGEETELNYISGGDDRATACPANNKIVRIGNKTHIVYAKGTSHGVYVRTYDHTSGTWSDEVEIAASCYDNHACPTIVADSQGYLYVFYDGHHTTLKWRKSTNPNDASSWSAAEAVPNQADNPAYPSAVVDSNDNIHLIYRNTGTEYLNTYYQKYDGSSWSNATILFEGNSSYHACYHCSLAIDDNDVIHAVAHWEKIDGDGGEVVGYAKSEDGGNTWKKSDGTTYTLPITRTSVESIQEGDNIRVDNIAVDNNGHPFFFVIDRDTSPQSGKFWRYNGSSWVSTTITETNHIRIGGSCTFYNGTIYIFTTVGTDYHSDDNEVFLFYSTDNGSTFTHKQISTTDTTEPNWNPSCEKKINGNSLSGVRVMWQHGDVDGETEIYVAKINDSYDAELYSFGTGVTGQVDEWVEDPNYTDGSVSAESSIVKRGNYSTKHTCPSSGYSMFFHPLGTIDSNNLLVEFYIRSPPSGKCSHFELNSGQQHNPSSQVALLEFEAGNLQYNDGSWHTVCNYTDETWYRIKLCNFDFSAHTYDIYVDGDLKVSGAGFKNALSSFDNFESHLNTDVSSYIDMLLVRKYADPEPTALLGTEQNISFSGCTAPTISSLTNSTPTTNSVTITWTTNQSADNRVKYSKNSDLSNPLWSSWDNDTTSVSITLTGLEANTTYYYQAWSYNGTNSSCYTVEPSSQPYRSFTTQSSSSQYTITLAQGYNMIGWTSGTSKTSSELCSIVPNCSYVYKKNPDGSWTTKHCGYPGGDFSVSRGFGFLAYITQQCEWTRDE